MKPTSARLTGEACIRALEAFSLYLQGADASLDRLLADLDEREVQLIRRRAGGFYNRLAKEYQR